MGGAALVPPWTKDGRGKYAEKPILVMGGACSIGQSAIQFARLSGFSPIVTTASSSNTNLFKSLGATNVVDRSADLTSASKAITPTPFTLIFDAISLPETQNTAYGILAAGGILIVVEPLGDQRDRSDQGGNLALGRGVSIPNRDIGVELVAHLTELLGNGGLKPNNVEVLPGGLAGIPDGLDRLRKYEVRTKKLLVHPQET